MKTEPAATKVNGAWEHEKPLQIDKKDPATYSLHPNSLGYDDWQCPYKKYSTKSGWLGCMNFPCSCREPRYRNMQPGLPITDEYCIYDHTPIAFRLKALLTAPFHLTCFSHLCLTCFLRYWPHVCRSHSKTGGHTQHQCLRGLTLIIEKGKILLGETLALLFCLDCVISLCPSLILSILPRHVSTVKGLVFNRHLI